MTTADDDQRAETIVEAGSSTAGTGEGGATRAERVLAQDAVVDFRSRWEVIQQGFVDDPRSAVTEADTLVRDLLDILSTTFEEQRRELEGRWSHGEPDTEELRRALQRYRDFFGRLLAV